MDDGPGVKSARRVLEVLELFADLRRPATVTEVARRLGYPQSSTSVLLAGLEKLGFLSFDASTRAYRPTLRVMLLGTWMHDELFGEGSLLSAMDKLRRRTGQTIMVGLRQGLHVRFILVVRGPHPDAMRYAAGTLSPVCRSAGGKILLSSHSDSQITRIARQANAETRDPSYKVVVSDLLAEIRQIRVNHWARSLDYPLPGRGTLAVALPRIEGQPAMSMVLGASKARIVREQDGLIPLMQAACAGLVQR